MSTATADGPLRAPMTSSLLFRLLLVSHLTGVLCTAPGDARWILDVGGLAASGLVPAEPGPRRAGAASPAQAMLARAALDYDAGRDDAALRKLLRAVVSAPEEAAGRRGLGCLLLARHDFAGAVVQLEAARRLAPSDAATAHALASAYFGALRLEDAIDQAHAAAALRPQWAEAHLRLGLLQLEAGREAEAEAAVTRALECPSVSPEVHYEVGNMLLDQGDAEGAAAYFRETLAWRPGHSFAANNLGNAYRTLERPADAREAYGRAIAADPLNPNPHNGLGVLLQAAGDVEGALAAYRKAAELDPAYVDARYNAGVLLLQANRPAEAVGELMRAGRLNPEFAQAFYQLGEALARLGRWREAEESHRRATALDPELGRAEGAVARKLRPGKEP